MKKLLTQSAAILILILIISSCKKNSEDVITMKEQPLAHSTDALKIWLLQNGKRFKNGQITVNKSGNILSRTNNSSTSELDWEKAIIYTFKGFNYKEIPYKLINTLPTNISNTRFSLVFRDKNNLTEAKIKNQAGL